MWEESWEHTKQALRWGTALLLAVLLAASAAAMAKEPEARTGDGTRYLVPVGHTVGIKLFSKGVLVVKMPEDDSPAKECGLRAGDVIVRCGGAAVQSTEQFQTLLQTCGQEVMDLQIRRGSRQVTLSVRPEQNEQGTYCIGAWIRDSMAGIGTVTYYEPATGVFGALGHGITDADTAQLMPFACGAVMPSAVRAVKKGEAGSAGELRGKFDLSGDIGALSANTSCGIFGVLETDCAYWQRSPVMPAAKREEVRTGAAVILANVEGDKVCEYDIEILKTISDAKDGRDMVITVTDPELIAATGGIVQGMSGSPILQDGKIVGAVTHVLLSDPCKGYGIFIETMLDAAE